MKHRFKNQCYNKVTLLDGCTTLKEYMKRLIKQSESQPERWDPMTYRGDGFEALVETLITLSPIDKRINIVDYRPWNSKIDGPDMGIDGLGKSHDGTIHTVQAKFRSNTDSQLTANEDHISNFVAKSSMMYRGKNVNMTIFTTAKNLLSVVNEEMYHDQVRVLGYNEISKMIDDNHAFWSCFRSEMNT